MKNLKELEDKITFLEQVLLPTKNISTVSLLDKIEFIEKRFTESNLKPQIAFLQKVKDLEVLSSKCNEDPTYFLSNRDKLKLLLSSNEILENIQLNLNDLNVLKQHLDFDPFIEIKEKNEIIMSLMENLKKNSQDFEGKNTRLNDLLTNNEGIITQINKKILYLDSILSVLEIKEKPIKS